MINVVIILSINLIKKENEILENRIVVGKVVVPKENSLLNKDKLYSEDLFCVLFEIPNCDNITINIDGFSQDTYYGVLLQSALLIECIAQDVNFEYLGNVYNVTMPLINVDNNRLPYSKLLNIKIDDIMIGTLVASYNEKYIIFSITISDMRIFF